MRRKLLGLYAFAALLSLSPAHATTYTYDVDYQINSTTVTGDIVLNCDSCNVTSSTLVSWSLSTSGSGTSATIVGTNLSATPSEIIFTGNPNFPATGLSWTSQFIGSSGNTFFGAGSSGNVVSGGSSGSSCLVSPPINGNVSELYGICSNGTLSETSDVGSVAEGFAPQSVAIATAATPLPTAFPLFAAGLGALGLLSWRRKRKAQEVLARTNKSSSRNIEGPLPRAAFLFCS